MTSGQVVRIEPIMTGQRTVYVPINGECLFWAK